MHGPHCTAAPTGITLVNVIVKNNYLRLLVARNIRTSHDHAVDSRLSHKLIESTRVEHGLDWIGLRLEKWNHVKLWSV